MDATASFAARTLAWKWIAQENQNLVYNIGNDPQESKRIRKSSPECAPKCKTTAASLLESLSSHQASSPRPRTISDEECAVYSFLGMCSASRYYSCRSFSTKGLSALRHEFISLWVGMTLVVVQAQVLVLPHKRQKSRTGMFSSLASALSNSCG